MAQTLIERWWDSTHTFHIADQEMTIIHHDFHHMISLQVDRALINLEVEPGTRLGLELLGRRYSAEMIRYTNLEVDFMRHP